MTAAQLSQASAVDALNAICPYFTMFPLRFPLKVLSGSIRGVVVDPFCGRGTTNLAARVLGMRTVAVDSSPVAVAATAAKLPRGSVDEADVVSLARHLLHSGTGVEVPTGPFWQLAYHEHILESLCRLREGLRHDRTDAARVLRAVVLGALHGPMRKDGSSSYFSNQSPRTFGPKPDYAVRFWTDRGLKPPRVDVLEIVATRAKRALEEPLQPVRARVARADSRKVSWAKLLGDFGPIDWIVTSPPYYGLRTYRPDQWLREWFLDGPSRVEYLSADQLSHSSPESFAKEVGLVFERLVPFCSKNARLVMRFGSINDRPVDPMEIVRAALSDSGWKIDTVCDAGLASAGRRQVKSFATTLQPARTEYDVWCSLA
jgi:hypothetical protein